MSQGRRIMMNTIRLLVTTLLVMTSTLVAAEEAKGSLTLTPQRVTDWLTLSGTVSAIHQGTVAAQTSGRVSRMLVDVNDEVQAGQPLLEISGKEQSAAVTGAEARVARAQAQQVEAERQLTRYQALIARGDHPGPARQRPGNGSGRPCRGQCRRGRPHPGREAYGYTRILAPTPGW